MPASRIAQDRPHSPPLAGASLSGGPEGGEPPAALAIVIGGVSGSGKSTVGIEVARRLGARFLDGDDFHPAANTAKMARNEPLDDEDRRPWLAALNQALASCLERGETVVLACSALKRSYRDRLTAGLGDIRLFMLVGDREILHDRVQNRHHDFMPASLLDSQLATLEPIDPGIESERRFSINVNQPVEAIVEAIINRV